MLSDILLKYKDVLTEAGVPIDPDKYVKYIEFNTIFRQEHPEAFVAIGKTFNDKRFQNE